MLKLILQLKELLVTLGLEDLKLEFEVGYVVLILDLQLLELVVQVGNLIFVGIFLIYVHVWYLLWSLKLLGLLGKQLL